MEARLGFCWNRGFSYMTRPGEEPISGRNAPEEPLRYPRVRVHPAHFEFQNMVLLDLKFQRRMNWAKPKFGYE